MANTKVSSEQIIDGLALGGNPTAATQTAGNNSTRIATTAYTDAAVTALIGGAPSTLDTLNEIAAAVSDNPDYVGTVNAALALKAPKASPVFTGTVTANAGVVVDNFTLDGTTLALSSGDMLVDVAGNITLDADDAGEIRLKDGGTQYGALKIDSSRFKIQSIISDADMLFAVNDGGSEITALSLDASAAGAATFNSTVTSTGLTANVPTGNGLLINSADVATIKMKATGNGVKNWGFATTNLAASDFGIYQSNANGGDPITAGAAKLYFNGAGAATFNSTVTSTGFTTSANTRVQASSGMLFLNGPSALAFEVGAGSEKMRLTSTGLGIGSSPVVWSTGMMALELKGYSGTTKQGSIAFDSHSGANGYNLISTDTGNMVFYNGATNRASAVETMRISSSGALVLNNAGGDAQMYFGGTSGTSRMYLARSGSDSLLFNISNGNLRFGTNGVERLRINSAAQVLVGTQSKISADQGNGGLAVHGDTAASGSVMEVKNTGNPNTGRDLIRFYNTSNGEAGSIEHTGTSTVSYLTSSDYRLKENVVTLTGASERLKQIPVKRFNFIADGSDVSVDGFLAHEVQAVVPEAISGTKDAMRDEEYEVTAAVYEDVTTPAVEAVAAVLDEDGVVITEAVEAQEATTESVLTTEAVMGTRSVPDYQGIDQAKLVPLLVAALQEAIARIEILEG